MFNTKEIQPVKGLIWLTNPSPIFVCVTVTWQVTWTYTFAAVTRCNKRDLENGHYYIIYILFLLRQTKLTVYVRLQLLLCDLPTNRLDVAHTTTRTVLPVDMFQRRESSTTERRRRVVGRTWGGDRATRAAADECLTQRRSRSVVWTRCTPLAHTRWSTRTEVSVRTVHWTHATGGRCMYAQAAC